MENEKKGIEKLLTTAQVAELLQISKSTVHSYQKMGLLKPIRITPKTVRFKQSDIEELIERGV